MLSLYSCSSFFYFERHDNGTKHRQSWMKIMSNGRIYQSVSRYACVDLFILIKKVTFKGHTDDMRFL